MNDNKYNGWTNYATWRVNLEILGDMDWYETEYVDADYLKELVEDIVFDVYEGNEIPKLVEDYAHAFLSTKARFCLTSRKQLMQLKKEFETLK